MSDVDFVIEVVTTRWCCSNDVASRSDWVSSVGHFDRLHYRLVVRVIASQKSVNAAKKRVLMEVNLPLFANIFTEQGQAFDGNLERLPHIVPL